MSDALIGFGGPLPILAIFLIIFRRRLKILQKLAFIIIVYIISILTGILSDVVLKVGSHPSAVIAGIVAPIVYCLIFSTVSLHRYSRIKGKFVQSNIQHEPDQKGPTAMPATANQWNPIIVAAIIQAIASVIVALITVLGKR